MDIDDIVKALMEELENRSLLNGVEPGAKDDLRKTLGDILERMI